MQKMSYAFAPYARYLVHSPDSEPWGLAVTAAGLQVCRPGEAYPPAGHPPDHAFSWEKGRVLASMQLILVTDGAGVFESRATGIRDVAAGTVLILLPGVWHRYRPAAGAGWVEHWVELRGRSVDALVRQGVFAAAKAVQRVERATELRGLFDGIHRRMRDGAARACDPERAAHGMQVLALLADNGRPPAEPRSMAAHIERAERLIADRLGEAPAMTEIARELGVAYSYFRREFKRHTGLSPQRYLSHLRLEKARRIIGGSDLTLKEIADELGFCSPYHLSAAFRRHFGLPPEAWRRQHIRQVARSD